MEKRESGQSFFEKVVLYIGIDVHKASWVVTIRTYELELRSFSMKPSCEELEELLKRDYPGAEYRIVYECCFSGFWIYDYFSGRGYRIIVTPTSRIYKDGSKIKTDRIDSRKLAFQLSRGLLKEVMVPEKKVREYKYIFRIYDKQKQRQGQILRQIRAILEQKDHALKWERWNKSMVKKLNDLKFEDRLFEMKFHQLLKEYEYSEDQIKGSEEVIEQVTKDQELGQRIRIIDGVGGIGTISAVRLVVFLFDKKEKFTNSQKLSHYLGLTPSERSSGERVIRGRSGLYGDRQLRSIIIQLAWMAVRKDGALLEKFNTVYKKSGSKQKAIVATARKLMTKIHASIRKNEDYRVNYQTGKAA